MICHDPTTGVFYNSLVGCPTNADPTRSLFDQWEHWLSQPLHLAIWCAFCFVVIVWNHSRRARPVPDPTFSDIRDIPDPYDPPVSKVPQR